MGTPGTRLRLLLLHPAQQRFRAAAAGALQGGVVGHHIGTDLARNCGSLEGEKGPKSLMGTILGPLFDSQFGV